MAVTTTTTSVSYTGNGSTTAFAVPFKFMQASDLVVRLTPVGGIAATCTPGTDYTVTGAGVDAGGTVTMTSAPASGATLSIARATALTQTTSFQTQGAFSPKAHEAALDKVTLEAQEVAARASVLETSVAAVQGQVQTALATIGGGGTYVTIKNNPTAPVSSAGEVNFRSNNGILESSEDGKTWTPVKEYVDCGRYCDRTGSTDAGPGFNSAIAEAKSRNIRTVYVPEGQYKTLTSINLTGINNGMNFVGAGIQAQLNGNCTGKAIIDMVGSNGLHVRHLWLNGDATNTPSAGILCARTTGDGSAGNHVFDNLTINGSYSIGTYVGVSSEQNTHIAPKYYNSKVGANGAAVVANNLWTSANYQYSGQPALTSDYIAISPTPAGGNTVHSFLGGFIATATGGGDTASTVLLMQGIRGLVLSGTFLQGNGAYGAYFKGTNEAVTLTGSSEDELFTTYGYYMEAGATVDRLVMHGFLNQVSPFYGASGSTLKNSILHAQFGNIASGPDAGLAFVVDNVDNCDINLFGLGGKVRTQVRKLTIHGDSSFWTFPSDTQGVDRHTQAGDPAGSGQTINIRHINDDANYKDRLYTKVLQAAAVQQRPQQFLGVTGTLTPNFWLGSFLWCNLAGNTTVANPSAGPSGNGGLAQDGTRYTFVFNQDATGGRTVSWGTQYKGLLSWQPNPAANSTSVVEFVLGNDGNYWALLPGSGRIVGNDFFLTTGTLDTTAAGSAVNLTYTTASLSLTALHDYVVVNASGGNVTITLPLPSAVRRGQRYKIHRSDSSANTVTVQPSGGATVDGAGSATLAFLHTYELVWDPNNSSWFYFNN